MVCADKVVDVHSADVSEWLQGLSALPKKTGGKRQKYRASYIDCICAFDIETSVLPHVRSHDGHDGPQAIMYIWMFQAGERFTIVGRTWEEYAELCAKIDARADELDAMLVVWDHNLSYEFQFLSGVQSPGQVFATKARKVLRAEFGRMEYRCSYLQTNMSLDAFTHKMGVSHGKLSGQLDYSKIRYPWTDLSDQELAYCVNDVRGLVEAISAEMEGDGDTLYTIPMTSTGYVRRDCKRAMYPLKKWTDSLQPDAELYKLLRDAFWGGDTHANRYYAGMVLEDVHSVDMASAYPAVQLTEHFPTTKFFHERAILGRLKLNLRMRRAVVCRIVLYDLELTEQHWGFPYLPRSKCSYIAGGVYDNGRVLQCQECVVAMTDIDLKIMRREYRWSGMRVLDLWSAHYGQLPKKLTDVVYKYYEAKTSLKGVSGQEVYYMKSKNKLNSVYGMTAQKPVRDDVAYTETGEWLTTPVLDEELQQALDENRRSLFLPYQWAVWTTAHTRKRLRYALHAAGEHAVYCDTDSVKYVGEIDLGRLSGDLMQLAKAAGAYATDPKGRVHYMGVFEQEKDYAEFETWGAKKYATTYKKGGKITTTIAGVSKQKGGLELMLWGGFKAFQPGFRFCLAGGSDLVYNDNPDCPPLEIDGHMLEITKNVAILDGDYTLGLTAEYARLLGYDMEAVDYETF